MHDSRYDVFFSGQMIQGSDPDQVRENIGRIFKADEKQLAHLFSGKRVCVKLSVDQDTAIRYRVAFREAGALVDILEAKKEHASAPATSAENPADEMTLLPARTGSLANCITQIESQLLPDITHLSLAAAGTTIDQSAPPPSVAFESESLTLNPPNTGSLEDCQIKKQPAPLPDISRIELEE